MGSEMCIRDSFTPPFDRANASSAVAYVVPTSVKLAHVFSAYVGNTLAGRPRASVSAAPTNIPTSAELAHALAMFSHASRSTSSDENDDMDSSDF